MCWGMINLLGNSALAQSASTPDPTIMDKSIQNHGQQIKVERIKIPSIKIHQIAPDPDYVGKKQRQSIDNTDSQWTKSQTQRSTGYTKTIVPKKQTEKEMKSQSGLTCSSEDFEAFLNGDKKKCPELQKDEGFQKILQAAGSSYQK